MIHSGVVAEEKMDALLVHWFPENGKKWEATRSPGEKC